MLAEDEHHVLRASVALKPHRLSVELYLGDGWYEPVEQDSGKYFASDGV